MGGDLNGLPEPGLLAADVELVARAQAIFGRAYTVPEGVAPELEELARLVADAASLDAEVCALAVADYFELATGDHVFTVFGPPTEATDAAIGKITDGVELARSDPSRARAWLDGLMAVPVLLRAAPDGEVDKAAKLQLWFRLCESRFRLCLGSGEDRARCQAHRRACRKRAMERVGLPLEADPEHAGGAETTPPAEPVDPAETARRRQERIERLAESDPDQGQASTPEREEKRRRDAEAAVGVEEQGKLRGVHRPSKGGEGDFHDADGDAWDVKRPYSRTKLGEHMRRKAKLPAGTPLPAQPPEFDPQALAEEVRVQRDRNGRKVIVDTRELTPDDKAAAKRAIHDAGLSGQVVYYPD